MLLVFVFHYGGGLRAHHPALRAFGFVTQAGWIGVELFFALSGYLITGILLDDLRAPGALPRFFRRRAVRILPLYLLALGLCAAAALLKGGSPAQLRPILLYAVFLQNVPPLQQVAVHTPPPLPIFHLWSLAVEEQFYLLWPMLVLLSRTPRRTLGLCGSVFALSALCRVGIAWSHTGPSAMQASAALLPVRAGALALGGALACARRVSGKAADTPPTRFLTGTCALLGIGTYVALSLRDHSFLLDSRMNFTLGLALVDLGAAALIALSLGQGLPRHLLSRPALGFLGRISYGVYVFHILLEPAFDRLGNLLTGTSAGFLYQATRLCVAFPVTLAIAWLSFVFFEQPFLRLGKSRVQDSLARSHARISEAHRA